MSSTVRRKAWEKSELFKSAIFWFLSAKWIDGYKNCQFQSFKVILAILWQVRNGLESALLALSECRLHETLENTTPPLHLLSFNISTFDNTSHLQQ